MGKILYGEELQKFIIENKVDCISIILTIDDTTKKAYYVIDGIKKISIDYEYAKQYFDNN